MIKFCKKCQSETERNNSGNCKTCARESYSAWRAANPEKSKARGVAWNAANPERFKAGNAAWRLANSERVRAVSAAWHLANAEKKNAANAAWRAANPERNRERLAAYRAANLDKVKAVSAAWRANNQEARRIQSQNRRARKLENGGTLSKGLSAKLFNLQRGKCPCCNKPLGDDFHLDHITPLARGGSNTDNNIQLLRASCNLSKSAKDPVQFMQQRGFLI